jgi:hypothetical protein
MAKTSQKFQYIVQVSYVARSILIKIQHLIKRGYMSETDPSEKESDQLDYFTFLLEISVPKL